MQDDFIWLMAAQTVLIIIEDCRSRSQRVVTELRILAPLMTYSNSTQVLLDCHGNGLRRMSFV